ncbi:MAG: 4-demethylwyosine synthase TYW1 [Acidilobaceae archaeon]
MKVKRGLGLIPKGLPDKWTPLVERLVKQGYHFAGRHSLVKKCYWTHTAIVERRFCYKCKFYGIASHRDIQMTPSAFWCWNACIHCWRIRPSDLGIEMDETRIPSELLDDPKAVLDSAIREQKRIISGYKGHPRADPKLVEEAMNPVHVTLSLTGEPTLYPMLDEFLREIHKRGMTSFLVTRGVRPDVLSELQEEPSQLYISIEAWDKQSYERLSNPLVPRAWELTLETLSILPSFSSPTVLRITLIKGLNDTEEALRGFSKLIELAQPTYVEIKAYMWLGASKNRLHNTAMPEHEDVKKVAEKLALATGYSLLGESKASRVVLLSKLSKPIRIGEGCPEGLVTNESEKGEYDDIEDY